MSDEIFKIRSLIADYITYKSLAQSFIQSNKFHANYADILKIIEDCDQKLVLLNTDLKKLQESRE